MNGNETLRKLLEDEKCGEVLELYEKCEINSFLEIEKYYSGGCMELNEDNVCDILRFSIYYNDNRIMRICKRYLKEHLNDSIVIEIFSIINGLNVNQLSDLKEIGEKYLMRKGYKFLNDDSLLLKLNIDSLNLILSNQKLIIKDENWLLNRLLLWYKNHQTNEDEKENEEEEEFVKLLKKSILLNEIKYEKISEEDKTLLKELQIEVFKNENPHISIRIDEIGNEELIEIINEYYIEEEEEVEEVEESEIELDEKTIEMLKESKEDLIKLLSNEDIKVIEIVLYLILKMKMNEIIPEEMKSDILGRICCEYRRNKRHLTLKCLCLFVDDVEYIAAMKCLCGKEALFKILNEEYYSNSKAKELLIKYIQEIRLSKKEKEEMSKIVKNEELLEVFFTKEISSFSYPQSEYSFPIYEEISIIPSFDGEKCEFSINPSLPSGILIDKENGIINGKVDKNCEKKEYEITCKNVRNEKKFKISLEFDIKFTELNKSSGITISNNGKVIEQTSGDYNHCYLNLKMENGIYHFKIKYLKKGKSCNNKSMYLGLSTNNTFSGLKMYEQPTTCNFWAYSNESNDISSVCHIGRVVNKNPNFKSHGEGSIYEIIVDINKREFWISHNNSSPVLLVKDLPSPLYPYAVIGCCTGNKYELLSVSHED